MRDEYSIEGRAYEIDDSRTREYFHEVFSCYTSGNYRSAVVMLWSVAVCDILFKLQKLEGMYGDETAKGILSQVKESQENKNPSAWEKKLLKLVLNQTELLDIGEYKNLLYLHEQRHLAAHPVINRNLQLHRPNREKARSLIRDTLEGLLTKPPIFAKKIFDTLVEDLEENSNILIDNKHLGPYLEDRYYKYFNSEVKKFVFRGFWRILFCLNDERCEKNRNINYIAFLSLFSGNPSMFRMQITDDKDYFSRISKEYSPMIYLIEFLAYEPYIYGLLDSQAEPAIRSIIATHPSARCLAHFTAESVDKHAEELENWIREEDPEIEGVVWGKLMSVSDSVEWTKNVVCLANIYYAKSGYYDAADKRFAEAIKPLLEKYDRKDIVDLMQKISENDQTYGRRLAQTDHKLIASRMRSLDPSFDFTKFKAFAEYQDQDL